MPAGFAALAIADGGANAVGAVRIVCHEGHLEIELVRIAGYVDGFALGAVAKPVRLSVPYTAIRGLFRRGKALCIALDPAACAPYSRFALARFEADASGAPGVTSASAMDAMAGAYRARMRARLASFVLPAPLGAIAAIAAPADLASGPLGTMSLGAVVALGVWVALRWAARAVTWGGPLSDRLRDAIELELSCRLGFVRQDALPSTALGGAGQGTAAVLSVEREGDDPFAWLRARALAPAAVAVIGIVGTLAFVRRFATPIEAPPSVSEALRLAEVVRALDLERMVREIHKVANPTFPNCLCHRADSPLWTKGVPILSVLVASGPDDGAGVIAPLLEEPDGAADAPGGPSPKAGHYDFELAVVNNSNVPLPEVHVVLTFSGRARRGRRARVTERGLFREGELDPGQAIKWHVKAPGTEVKIEPSSIGMIEGEMEPAPADAFFTLTRARYRVVRMHAAMMLAYLRDPRVHDALLALSPPTVEEESTLARIRRASADVLACSIAAEEGRLRACLFNASASPLQSAALREISERADVVPRSWALRAVLPVHEGIEVSLPLSGDSAPTELAVEVVRRGN